MRRVLLTLCAILAIAGITIAYAIETEPSWYVRLRYPLHYGAIVRGHAKNYRLDPALVAAVIYAESKFDPATTSRAGAVGLMQLLPDTAQGIADRTGGGAFTPADLLDPELNIRYGCWYLNHLRSRYRGKGDALVLSLAAYNAGQANVDSWLAAAGDGAAVAIPFAETRAYIDRVLHLRALYRRAYDL